VEIRIVNRSPVRRYSAPLLTAAVGLHAVMTLVMLLGLAVVFVRTDGALVLDGAAAPSALAMLVTYVVLTSAMIVVWDLSILDEPRLNKLQKAIWLVSTAAVPLAGACYHLVYHQTRGRKGQPSATRKAVASAIMSSLIVLLAVSVPVLDQLADTHRELGVYLEECPPRVVTFSRYSGNDLVVRLGGPGDASRHLSFYARLPGKLVPARVHAVRCLGYCGKPALPDLVQFLRDSDPHVRVAAASALGWIGADAADANEALLLALEDPDPKVRAAAAYAFCRTEPTVVLALRPLLNATGDSDPEVRGWAAVALTGMEYYSDEVLEAFMSLLRDPSPRVRGTAARLLDGFGERAFPRLCALADDPDPGMRTLALVALAEVKLPDSYSERISERLMRGLNDSAPGVRTVAAFGLADHPGSSKAAAAALERALDDPDLDVRRAAAMALSEVDPASEKAIAVLLSWLEGRNAVGNPVAHPRAQWIASAFDPRASIACALKRFGPRARSAVPALAETLRTGRWFAGACAADALGEIGGPEAIQALQEMRDHEDEWVRDTVRRELKELKEKSKKA
jgi:HEAT repeat protein